MYVSIDNFWFCNNISSIPCHFMWTCYRHYCEDDTPSSTAAVDADGRRKMMTYTERCMQIGKSFQTYGAFAACLLIFSTLIVVDTVPWALKKLFCHLSTSVWKHARLQGSQQQQSQQSVEYGSGTLNEIDITLRMEEQMHIATWKSHLDSIAASNNDSKIQIERQQGTECVECSICLATFESNDSICRSHKSRQCEKTSNGHECGHIFHSACLASWFRRGNSTCPCCRTDLLTL